MEKTPMPVMMERPADAAVDDTTLVKTSCTAMINAPIEKVDIPSWCFSLPDSAARQAGLRVYYALHHRYRPGDYETWRYIAPIEKAAWQHKSFEYGTWRGEIRSGFGPLPGPLRQPGVPASAADAPERLGLTGAGDRAVKRYPGGMRRRLDIAATRLG